MKLIITEKDLSARRIAQVLSRNKVKTEKLNKVPVYEFTGKDGEDTKCIGLKGHILAIDFPEEYKNWLDVDPVSLINAEIVKIPSEKNIVKVLQKIGKEADLVISATDFDREGELIGVEALEKIKEVKSGVRVKRARYSSLTESEIKGAFDNLEDVYLNLASAGEARQDVDLIWGAVLTRFTSRATGRLGNRFLSVGRVQTPTLRLIAEREKERISFVPQTYWQIKGLFEKDGETFEAYHSHGRFLNKKEAEEVLQRLKETGEIKSIQKKERWIASPAPFNTTSFLSAAASLGLSVQNAMRIAEGLYMHGFISYPRTDNTVYPPAINIKEVLYILKNSPDLGELAQKILGQKIIQPTRGKKEAKDHPPIYPVNVVEKEKLSPQDWKIYELVVRRFFATLAPKNIREDTTVEIDVNKEIFIAKGSIIKEWGWLEFYPYQKRKEEFLPKLEVKDIVKLLKYEQEEKQTEPPPRYSQSTLIKKMEQLMLGTKSTRHVIIQNLYDRRYIYGNPIIPTETGLAIAEALTKYAKPISEPEMTRNLEISMDRIAEGDLEANKVVNESREILSSVMSDLKLNQEGFVVRIKEGIREDTFIGKCTCGGDLKIIRAKKSGKRFVGCSNYPQCNKAFPLPQSGEILRQEESCPDCGMPRIQVIIKGKRRKRGPWILCINPECPSKKNKIEVNRGQ